MERRHRRSDDPARALTYQLEACRQRARLDAMILADADGLPIASSGHAESCEELAARVSVMRRDAHSFESELWTHAERWDVHVFRFELGGAELSLCAVGGMPDDRARALARSQQGVARILAA